MIYSPKGLMICNLFEIDDMHLTVMIYSPKGLMICNLFEIDDMHADA